MRTVFIMAPPIVWSAGFFIGRKKFLFPGQSNIYYKKEVFKWRAERV